MKSLQRPMPPAAQRLSTFLAVACLGLAIALPVITLYGLCTTSAVVWLARLGGAASATSDQLGFEVSPWQSGVAVLIAMLPVCGMAYGLLRARLCFVGFVRGQTFSLGTVRHLRGFAAGIVVSAVAGLLSPALIGMLLTLGESSGKHSLILGVSSNDALMLLFAGIVWQVAHVMTQAAELADEHAQIV